MRLQQPMFPVLPALAIVLIAVAPALGAQHVIHIAVDGLNSDMLRDLIENQNAGGDYDSFQRLIESS